MIHRLFAALLPVIAIWPALQTEAQEILFDFRDDRKLSEITARDIEMSVDAKEGKLVLRSGHTIDWPGLTLKPTSGSWDASAWQNMSFEIENTGDHSFEIGLRIDNTEEAGGKTVTVMAQIKPGELRTVSTAMTSTPLRFSSPIQLVGMHAAPGHQFIDPTKISQAIIFLRQPSHDHQFSISKIRFDRPLKELDAETFLPFIDQYGQFIHDDWPGKTNSDEQLIQRREQESAELAEESGPANFNKFGGWKSGPQHPSKKHFRVEKHEGKWWLIDPTGARFWSHGIDSVSWNFSSTGVEHRENYFRNLPKEGERGSEFYFQATWGIGYYSSRTPFRMYNFLASNLSRKYGADWSKQFADISHRRLRSWGINTMACWSEPKITQQRKTPYTVFVRVEGCPVLKGAKKMWTQFADVYDPKFEEAIQHGIDACSDSIGDPWCVGFFVDNELFWGEDHSLALWTLQCPKDQIAKQVLVDDLKTKYESIDKLNTSWHSEYESWEALLESTEAPSLETSNPDLLAFSRKFSEHYFATVSKLMKNRAPDQLYLGCRFIWQNETALRAACRHCDVVSFNCYRYSPSDIRLPEGEDKPIIIGEYHFGALDRGMFHPSKVPSKDQNDRATCYRNFVTDALRHPGIVGTHWFQYVSESTSGRGDGENYQVGFVDICDTPYTETIEAAREIGYNMYELRNK